jgi:hypothetical protein
LGRNASFAKRARTFLLVYSEDNDDLVAPNPDQLLDTPDTTSREFGKQNHAVDVVVLEELDVGSHIGDLYRARRQLLSKKALFLTVSPTCFTFTITKLSISGYFSS